ncbi:MAG: Trx7/PDZ domain-containing (seleno)protein [Verrucomicrobia bacterium]|nr:Trx7/PDZ domain-containing (seleno)protein [Verrucomicrobiota bacterium]
MKTLHILTLFCIASLHAEAVKDREGAVRADKARMENDARWAYNDIDSGFKQAKLTGKPLLVVLRCVPCLSCMGLDSAVLMQGDELAPLLDQFVCVRVINANALDLTKLQFDYDLSFSTLFFNGDGTTYGRYGSWSHQKNSADTTITGYKRALEAALKIHAGYPANKAQLAGKQPGSVPYVNPTAIPKLAEKYTRDLNWDGKVVQSCIHCHMIGDAMRASYRDQKQPVPLEWIYPMPAPQTVGMTLMADQIATLSDVIAGSVADKAGLKNGDQLVSINAEPLVSTADVSWALHRSGDEASLSLDVLRAGVGVSLKMDLPKGWRYEADNSGRVSAWSMRAMAAGGMNLVALNEEERKQRGLSRDGMALWVKGLGMYGPHATAKKAGFQKDDVLLQVAEIKDTISESRLHGQLLQDHPQGELVPVTVWRAGKKLELSLPMQ